MCVHHSLQVLYEADGIVYSGARKDDLDGPPQLGVQLVHRRRLLIRHTAHYEHDNRLGPAIKKTQKNV